MDPGRESTRVGAVTVRTRGNRALEARTLSRAFRLALTVAFLLHVPFFPSRFARIVAFLFHSPEMGDYDDPDAEAIVPIDLDLEGKILVAEAPSASATAHAPDAEGDADAGAPHAQKAKPKDAGPPDDAGAAPVQEPIVAAGKAGEIAAKNPNVQVLISGDCLRSHDLAAAFGKLLRAIPEWSSFFEGTPIDPIQDLAHMLVTGPRFHDDSSGVVAVMDFKASEEKMREIVEGVVKHAGGAAIEGAPLPAWRAKLEGADRIF